MKVLVLNCGSSSVKYQLLDMRDESVLARGAIERLGGANALLRQQRGSDSIEIARPVPNHQAGIELILSTLQDPAHGAIKDYSEMDAVGHRVVHAGERYTGSVLITEDVITALEDCVELAPLHNPHNLSGIRACRAAMPAIPQVVVFDNALHWQIPQYARTYAIPHELAAKHRIKRYGFHGIAFRSALQRSSEFLNCDLATMKVVTLMLGSGTTANAFDCGKSVDVSTGFTPHEGLVQSTRSGDMDAAIVIYLMEKEGFSPAEMSEILNKKSGWLGISGISQDLRDVFEAADAGNAQAQLAIDTFCYRCRKYVGAYAAAMGGMDLLIFTGGVGEKSPRVRWQVASGLEFMGLSLDAERNECQGVDRVISSDDSRVTVVTVVVNEELVIARDTIAVASANSSATSRRASSP